MRQLLAERNLRLTKSLGQNFLHDANQLRRIVKLADLGPSDRVLEVGPGLGPLTELLVARADKVLAVEKDGRLVELLEDRLGPTRSPEQYGEPNPPQRREGHREDNYALKGGGDTKPEPRASTRLRLVHADALEYLRQQPHDWSQWKLVANLPYSVASPILVELSRGTHGPERMVVTLQIEVARRLMAQAGARDYGVLTLLVQKDYQPQDWFKIPASCFFPAPDVDSACVCLTRRPQPLLRKEDRDLFGRIVKRAFSQRRKMMFKLLKAQWPERALGNAFQQLALATEVRAETVTLEQFVRLTRCLSSESTRA
jgi:16S rRNA (adenine1518-N6/adenine1519-N6)-dimethyltransferase